MDGPTLPLLLSCVVLPWLLPNFPHQNLHSHQQAVVQATGTSQEASATMRVMMQTHA